MLSNYAALRAENGESVMSTENLEQLMDAIERVKRLSLEKVQELRTGDSSLSFGEPGKRPVSNKQG